MKHGYLSEYFTAVAAKTLSSVETNPEVSHQHELNGVAALREMLGTQRRRFAAHFMYLSDEEDTQVEGDGTLTWYDSREQKPKRSPEWRGYSSRTPVSEAAASGDLIVIGRRPDDSLLIVIAAAGSTVANQVLWLFGLGEASPSFAVRSGLETDQDRLDYTSRVLLESLGMAIGVEVEGETFLDRKPSNRFPVSPMSCSCISILSSGSNVPDANRWQIPLFPIAASMRRSLSKDQFLNDVKDLMRRDQARIDAEILPSSG